MGYQENRAKRIQIFEDTLNYCEAAGFLADAIKRTRENTVLYRNPDEECGTQGKDRYQEPCTVVVSSDRTLQAAERLCRQYGDSRIGILNFASATNPGGGVIRGSNAQEECLCRCSTLYPCLRTDELLESFYGYHQKRHNPLYSDACIYTPGIVGIKTDTKLPELMSEEDWFLVDVISCAAPNLRENPSNVMNPFAGDKITIEEKELEVLLERRVRGILQVAAKNQIDVLVLGAFGCGAFCNSPYMVADAFKKALKEYQYAFRAVEFAVYCTPDHMANYDIFLTTLKNLC
ncbi:MAG: TIGR02452 family protein [Lachnospiraceae bacterium]